MGWKGNSEAAKMRKLEKQQAKKEATKKQGKGSRNPARPQSAVGTGKS